MISMRLLIILFGAVTLLTLQTSVDPVTNRTNLEVLATPVGQSSFLGDPLSSNDQQLVNQISTSEWLGPLAPIAISPFFGITCLAGIAQFGGDFLPVNAFVSDNVALQSQFIFWLFLVLTLVTSIPRFTKVSKPFAQALDQVEAYAGIITIVILRFVASPPESPDQVAVVQMGVLSFSADVLLSVAAIINIIVINSIKFFFEVLVWLIPIPFVDGLLEALNKSICAGLMAVYAWSPFVATIINIGLFLICFLVFNWVRRRIRMMRTLLIDPLWATVFPSYGKLQNESAVVFLKSGMDGMAAKAMVELSKTEAGWQLLERRMLFRDRAIEFDSGNTQLDLRLGLFFNEIVILSFAQSDGEEETEELARLYISRRYNGDLPGLIEQFSLTSQSEAAAEQVAVDW